MIKNLYKYFIIIKFYIIYIKLINASYCGESTIPFSFEASPTGYPILGCARPTCFGWTVDGNPASASPSFYVINKKKDGFIRKTFNKRPLINKDNANYFRPQTAECFENENNDNCLNHPNAWIAGLGPIFNVSSQPLSLKCCKYNPLNLSTDQGVASVHSNEVVIGGEVMHSNRQYAFDYISDITKFVNENGTVVYYVSLRRFPCLSYPPEFSVDIEENFYDEFYSQFLNVKKINQTNNAYQAPIFTGGIINTPNNNFQNIQLPEQRINQQNQINQNQIYQQNQQNQQNQINQNQLYQQNQNPYQNSYNNRASYGSCNANAGGSGNPLACSLLCFSADSTINLLNGKTKRMDELEIGDWIMSANVSKAAYYPVTHWIHRDDDLLAQFYLIKTEYGKTLKLTGKHFIYKTECVESGIIAESITERPSYAEDIKAGNCLYIFNDKNNFELHRVQSVQIVEERGIYSPMTENGKIVVNDILASCFNVIDSPALQDTFFSYIKKWQTIPFLKWLFGDTNSNKQNLPFGLKSIIDLMHYIVPKNVFSS